MARRVLYINLDFPPMSGPGIWRALAFAKYLPELDHEVTVLCSDRSPSRSRFDESLCSEIPLGVKVQRIPSYFQGDIAAHIQTLMDHAPGSLAKKFLRRVLSRFVRYYPDQQFHWALNVAVYGLQLAARGKVDVLLTSGPPHICHLAGLIISTLRPLPWVMDYRDLWTDDRVQIKQTSYQQAVFERLEAACVAKATRIVAVSPGYIEHLTTRFSKSSADYDLVRNGHDVSPETIEQSRTLPDNTRLHIHFNGTPQVTHPFSEVLKALDRLRFEDGHDRDLPQVTFTGVPAKFEAEIEALNLGAHVRDVGHMSRTDSINYSLGCDVLLAMVNAKNPLYRGTIPGKAYEALALGRHLLGLMPKHSVLAEMIEAAGEGTLVDVSNPNAIYEGFTEVRRLFRNGQLNRIRTEAQHQAIAQLYSRRTQTQALVEVFDRACEARA